MLLDAYFWLKAMVFEDLAHGIHAHTGSLKTRQPHRQLLSAQTVTAHTLLSPYSTALREAFPLKKKESIQELLDASRSKLDSTEDLIDYMSLFKEVS